MKKCKHAYEFDGGPCVRCGMTVPEQFDEERQKFLDYDFKKPPDKKTSWGWLKKIIK